MNHRQISRDFPRAQDILCATTRVRMSFWQALKFLFTRNRSIQVYVKTYTTKFAGERLATKVTWSYEKEHT